MSQLTPEQQEALTRACEVIERLRANDIHRLKHWDHGMCGCLNAVKPEVRPVSPQEDAAIRKLWHTLPGYTSWMTALFLLCNQPQEDSSCTQ
jgi:hypothetical protein